MTYSFHSADNQHFSIEKTLWQEKGEQLSKVRHTVFIEEQKVSAEEEWDGLDEAETTQHFYVETIDALSNDTPLIVATARVLESGKIGRLCVLKEYRQKGLGQALMQEILHELITQQQHEHVYLNAQSYALDFYRTLGFVSVGEEFEEAGIPHVRMELDLTAADSLRQIYNNRVLRLDQMSQFQFQLEKLILNGHYCVDILSQQLNPQLYTLAVTEAISLLVRNHRQAQARILIDDTKALVGQAHPLIQLSQRISSHITVKTIKNGPEVKDEAYIIVDKKHLLFFNNENEFEGFIRYDAAAECEHLLQNFEHIWQVYGATDPELSRLYI